MLIGASSQKKKTFTFQHAAIREAWFSRLVPPISDDEADAEQEVAMEESDIPENRIDSESEDHAESDTSDTPAKFPPTFSPPNLETPPPGHALQFGTGAFRRVRVDEEALENLVVVTGTEGVSEPNQFPTSLIRNSHSPGIHNNSGVLSRIWLNLKVPEIPGERLSIVLFYRFLISVLFSPTR